MMDEADIRKLRRELLDMGMEPELIDAIMRGEKFFPDLLTDEEKLPFSSRDIKTEGNK